MQLKGEGNSVSGRGNSKYESPEAQKPLASFGMAHSPLCLDVQGEHSEKRGLER